MLKPPLLPLAQLLNRKLCTLRDYSFSRRSIWRVVDPGMDEAQNAYPIADMATACAAIHLKDLYHVTDIDYSSLRFRFRRCDKVVYRPITNAGWGCWITSCQYCCMLNIDWCMFVISILCISYAPFDLRGNALSKDLTRQERIGITCPIHAYFQNSVVDSVGRCTTKHPNSTTDSCTSTGRNLRIRHNDCQTSVDVRSRHTLER